MNKRQIKTRAEVLVTLDIPEDMTNEEALFNIIPSFEVHGLSNVEVVDREMITFDEIPPIEENTREVLINYEVNVALRVPNNMSAVQAAFFVCPDFRIHGGPPGLEVLRAEPVDIWTEDGEYLRATKRASQ